MSEENANGGNADESRRSCPPRSGLDSLQTPLTDRAWNIIQHAAKICDEREHEFLDPDHLWLGFFTADRGVGLATLEKSGVSLENLKKITDSAVPKTSKLPRLGPTWTANCLSILAEALRISEDADDPYYRGYVGTEHLAWALLKNNNSKASSWLRDQGLTRPSTRKNSSPF